LTLDRKGHALLLTDVAAVCAAALGANYLRFDEIYPAGFIHFEKWLLLDLILTPLVFYVMGLYRSAWRYASISDLKVIVFAVTCRTLLLTSLFILLGYDRGVPRSTIVLQGILLLGAVGGTRLLTRVRREMSQQKNLRHKTPVVIVGAGDAGEIILRELRGNRTLPYNPIGFVDDDPAKWGVRIHGVPVLGGTADIPAIASSRRVKDAIIAIPSASGRQLAAIYKVCKSAGVRAKTVPPVSQLIDGRLSLSQIRNVELEDLLGREAVSVEMDVIRESLAGKRVLITGGAGSIGRELARQVAGLGPERLVVFDRNENSMYFTELDLRKRFPSVSIDCVVGDILDRSRLNDLMEVCAPQIVFHAAAFKHVPMMEVNAAEAFKNNVLGTRNVAEKAAEMGVERFVLISTDKAVNPVSVMGGTKRLAELVLQDIRETATRFVSVRFGNVLGSDGSVVPLFKKQIADGGPVTVTHPEVTRYFMTITEAVQLVLQAGSMGVGGEVFLLDMGEPIRIVDLARNLIELSGFRPDEDIEIVFTGLRPGEKLHEELYYRSEEWGTTAHAKILKFRNGKGPVGAVLPRIQLMEHVVHEGPAHETDEVVRRALTDLIPEFRGATAPDTRKPVPGRTPVRAAYI
jgi:FlaA1/EpsC-like NDP-sugar epimerase